jgi:hypothetical protein
MADAAAARWVSRARAEAASADHFELMARRLHDAGLTSELVDRLRAAALDERRHATLCDDVACSLGSPAAPRTDNALGLPPLRGATAAARLVEEVIFLLAAGESLAIALLREAQQPPCEPSIAAVLAQIEADEQLHAALGWELLDALAAAHPAEAPSWSALAPRMAVLVQLGAEATAPPADHRRHGVLGRQAVSVVCGHTLATRVAPALLRRALWSDPPRRERKD